MNVLEITGLFPRFWKIEMWTRLPPYEFNKLNPYFNVTIRKMY